MKNIFKISIWFSAIALLFGACLKKENVDLVPSPLEPLENPSVAFFKIDSVSFEKAAGGTTDVTVYYAHIYNTFPEATKKLIGGSVIVTPQRTLFVQLEQKQLFFREQSSGTVINLRFGFSLKEGQALTQMVDYKVTVP